MLIRGRRTRGCIPERGECGIVWIVGRDGHPFCIYKSGIVTPEKCATCERRPPSLRKGGGE